MLFECCFADEGFQKAQVVTKEKKVWKGALHRRVTKQVAELRAHGRMAAAEELESTHFISQNMKVVTPPLQLPVIAGPSSEIRTGRTHGPRTGRSHGPPTDRSGRSKKRVTALGSNEIVLRNNIDHQLLAESSSRGVEQLIGQLAQPQRLMAGVHSIRGLQHQPLYPVQASGFPAMPRLVRDMNHGGSMSMNRSVYASQSCYRTM